MLFSLSGVGHIRASYRQLTLKLNLDSCRNRNVKMRLSDWSCLLTSNLCGVGLPGLTSDLTTVVNTQPLKVRHGKQDFMNRVFLMPVTELDR